MLSFWEWLFQGHQKETRYFRALLPRPCPTQRLHLRRRPWIVVACHPIPLWGNPIAEPKLGGFLVESLKKALEAGLPLNNPQRGRKPTEPPRFQWNTVYMPALRLLRLRSFSSDYDKSSVDVASASVAPGLGSYPPSIGAKNLAEAQRPSGQLLKRKDHSFVWRKTLQSADTTWRLRGGGGGGVGLGRIFLGSTHGRQSDCTSSLVRLRGDGAQVRRQPEQLAVQVLSAPLQTGEAKKRSDSRTEWIDSWDLLASGMDLEGRCNFVLYCFCFLRGKSLLLEELGCFGRFCSLRGYFGGGVP